MPKVFNLKEMISAFVEHRREVVTRRTLFELNKAEARAHVLEGLKIALDGLDQVIKLIRSSKDPSAARKQMVKRFKMTDVQAQAVLDMRLQRLTNLERNKIVDELKETKAEIKRLEGILASEKKLFGLIVGELEEIKERYADPRRTEIIADAMHFTIEDLIAEEEMVITCSHAGYVKRTPLTLYRQQRRWRQGSPRRGHQRGGLPRAPVHRVDALLHPGVHRPGPLLLVEGLRSTADRAGKPWQGNRQPARAL